MYKEDENGDILCTARNCAWHYCLGSDGQKMNSFHSKLIREDLKSNFKMLNV